MEPISIPTENGNHITISNDPINDDSECSKENKENSFVKSNEKKKDLNGSFDHLHHIPEEDEAEDNEMITHTPLLQKTGLDDNAQTSKEDDSNSRSGSTSVKFDGIILDVLNATTIHIDWCPVTNSGTVGGYKIRYAARDNSSYNEIFVTPGISNYTITGLRPNTEFDISVNAVDEQENVIQTCGWVRQKTDELGDGQSSKFETPYLTAAAAIALLLVAVVVPVTFLFVRNCGHCAAAHEQKERPAVSDNQVCL